MMNDGYADVAGSKVQRVMHYGYADDGGSKALRVLHDGYADDSSTNVNCFQTTANLRPSHDLSRSTCAM